MEIDGLHVHVMERPTFLGSQEDGAHGFPFEDGGKNLGIIQI